MEHIKLDLQGVVILQLEQLIMIYVFVLLNYKKMLVLDGLMFLIQIQALN